MAKVAFGSDEDGPWLKVTDDAFDPRTEDDANYNNFRFNSKYADLGYIDQIWGATFGGGNPYAGYSDWDYADGSSATGTYNGYPYQNGLYVIYRNNYRLSFYFGGVRYRPYAYLAGVWTGYNSEPPLGSPVVLDYYLTISGWNYQNYWVSVNRTWLGGGGNEWSSVAYFETAAGEETVAPYNNDGSIPGDTYEGSVNTVRSVQDTSNDGYSLSGTDLTLFFTNLPADDTTPVPWEEDEPEEGQRVISVDDTGLKIARRGFDVRTASDEQLIVGGSTLPFPIYLSRRIQIDAGQTVEIELPSWVPASGLHVLMQWNRVGYARRLPSLYVGSTSTGTRYEISWQIVSGVLYVRNQAPYDYDVLFFLVGKEPPTEAETSVIVEGTEDGESYVRLMQDAGVVAVDSRWSYAPIVQMGVVDMTTGTTAFSDGGAGIKKEIAIPDLGYSPFVLSAYSFLRDGALVTIGPRLCQNRYNAHDYMTNVVEIGTDLLTFKCWPASSYWLMETHSYTVSAQYFRYYVLAVPDVLAA